MALPPRPMGSLVDSAMAPAGGAMDPSAVDVSVLAPENFEGGAAVTDDGQGGAIIQALAAAMEEMSSEELIPHDANLAEFLDEGYLGEISTELQGAYEDDLSSRSEWEEGYTKGLDQLGVRYEERSQPFEALPASRTR